MKVSELLEAVDASVSANFPKPFISKVYKTFTLKSGEKAVETDKRPTLSDLKKKVYLSKAKDGSVYAVGYYKNVYSHDGGTIVIMMRDGKVEKEVPHTVGGALKLFKPGKYYTLNYSDSWAPTRSSIEIERDRDANSAFGQGVLRYMNDTFGPRLKKEISGYITKIQQNLFKLKKEKGPLQWRSDREVALRLADSLEDIMNNGFKRENIEDFIHDKKLGFLISGAWGRIPNTWSAFVDLALKEKAFTAQFAKSVFKRARELEADVDKLLADVDKK